MVAEVVGLGPGDEASRRGLERVVVLHAVADRDRAAEEDERAIPRLGSLDRREPVSGRHDRVDDVEDDSLGVAEERPDLDAADRRRRGERIDPGERTRVERDVLGGSARHGATRVDDAANQLGAQPEGSREAEPEGDRERVAAPRADARRSGLAWRDRRLQGCRGHSGATTFSARRTDRSRARA